MTTRGSVSSPAEKPTVYRGVAALIGGVLAALFCLYGAIDLLVEAGSADMVGAAVLLLVVSLALVFGVYPAAFSDADGLLVRNPFRTIRLPWSTVTEVSARLSFVAHTESARFTVFAIPVSLRDRRKVDKQRLRSLAQAQREAKRGRGDRGADMFGGPRPQRQTDRIEHMAFADQAIAEMNERRAAYAARAKVAATASAAGAGNGKENGNGNAADGKGQSTEAGSVGAPEASTVRWSWPSLALTGASALFLIIAIIVK